MAVIHQYTHCNEADEVCAQWLPDGTLRLEVRADGDPVQYINMSGAQARRLLADLRDTPRVEARPESTDLYPQH